MSDQVTPPVTPPPSCTCEDGLKLVGIHNTTCAFFQNFIPNEKIEVFIMAPQANGPGQTIAVSPEDKQLAFMLNAVMVAATQARDAGLSMIGRKYGVVLGRHEFWNYDLDNGVWVRTR